MTFLLPPVKLCHLQIRGFAGTAMTYSLAVMHLNTDRQKTIRWQWPIILISYIDKKLSYRRETVHQLRMSTSVKTSWL